MILTAVGKHKDTAMPCMARNMISWMPVSESPHASTKMPCRKQPRRKVFREPTKSAIEPARMRRHPVVSLVEMSD